MNAQKFIKIDKIHKNCLRRQRKPQKFQIQHS